MVTVPYRVFSFGFTSKVEFETVTEGMLFFFTKLPRPDCELLTCAHLKTHFVGSMAKSIRHGFRKVEISVLLGGKFIIYDRHTQVCSAIYVKTVKT